MACTDCEANERLLEAGTGGVFWFRWGAARIGIIGCRNHASEVMDALRKAQEGKQ